jgi:hypothetical protein
MGSRFGVATRRHPPTAGAPIWRGDCVALIAELEIG